MEREEHHGQAPVTAVDGGDGGGAGGAGDGGGAGEDALRAVAEGDISATTVTRLARTLARSARTAGAGAVASGRWLAATVMDFAPRIPVRTADVLVAQHGGLTGQALADELVRKATWASAAVGAASGAIMGAEELAPPAWVTLPIELAAETLAVAAIEMKLIAELHEAFGLPVPGSAGERGASIVRAWAERRGVTITKVAAGGGLSEVLSHGTRDQVMKLLRRRLLRRMGRNLTSLTPFLIGAAAGAEANRRATRSLGEAVVRDLAGRLPPGA